MKFLPLFIGLSLVLSFAAGAQEHEHIGAGSASTDQGSQLVFHGAEAYLAESGYVWETSYQPDGYFTGKYATQNITFTALAATPFFGGPETGHAAVGTDLKLRVVAVSGPVGGSFGYWEAGWHYTHTEPTAAFLVGSANPTSYANTSLSAFSDGYWTFNLSQQAPVDPYGHVHERGYSFTLPGEYDIGFQIVDTTGYHTPSEVYTLSFGVVPEPSSFLLLVGAVVLLAMRWRRRI